MDRATKTRDFKRGVYKLGCAGKVYYRLALELGVDAKDIAILDERRK